MSQRHRASRPGRRGLASLAGDVYTGVLCVVVAGCLLAPHASVLVAPDPPGRSAGAEPVLTGVVRDPGWVPVAVLLAVVALALGPLGRVGPLFLRPHEALWWLPLPGRRDGLLSPVARAGVVVAGGLGAVAGVVVAVLAGSGVVAVLAWAGLLAALGGAVLVGLVGAQCRGTGTRSLRVVLAAAAAGCLAASVLTAFPRTSGGGLLLAAGAAVLAGSTVLSWLAGVRGRLVDLHDAVLLASVARSLGAHVYLLSLDTRGLGRILGPPSAPPRRPSRLPLVAWTSRLSWLPRWLPPVVGVAQADLLLLVRQPRRLLQVLVGLVVAVAAQLAPGASIAVRTVAWLGGAWVAVHAVAEPARQAWFDDGPDSGWPVGPLLVRLGHLLVPAAAMASWCGLALLPAAGPAGLSAWAQWGLVVVTAGLGWAGAALRSGMRPMPDFTAGLVASPLGSVPPGVLQAVVAGSDAALVAGMPTLLVVNGLPLSLPLAGLQAVVACVVVVWGLGATVGGATETEHG